MNHRLDPQWVQPRPDHATALTPVASPGHHLPTSESPIYFTPAQQELIRDLVAHANTLTRHHPSGHVDGDEPHDVRPSALSEPGVLIALVMLALVTLAAIVAIVAVLALAVTRI